MKSHCGIWTMCLSLARTLFYSFGGIMIVGYARTSSFDQVAGIEAQERDLAAAGCEKIFREHVSSVDVAKRDQLVSTLDFLRDGDTLVVSKLDRLARSVAHMHELVNSIT